MRHLTAENMPAFRQVGEKQLPNPVLCMAWSPKRDLIALANTAGEVGSNRLLCKISRHLFFGLFVMVCFFCSCYYTAWLVFSVFGACSPVNILGRRLPPLPGDLMAKVRHDYVRVVHPMFANAVINQMCWILCLPPQFWPSVLATPSRWSCVVWRKQRSSTSSQCRILWRACTGWRWQRRTGIWEDWGPNKWCTDYLQKSVNYCFFFCFSALSSFSQSEDESKLFLPKLPTLPKR